MLERKLDSAGGILATMERVCVMPSMSDPGVDSSTVSIGIRSFDSLLIVRLSYQFTAGLRLLHILTKL